MILREIDQATGWAWFGFGPNGSRALLAMLAASMLSFLVFLFSALMIAVQIASAQLTPRVIATTFLQDRPVRLAIGLIVFTYTLSIGVIGRSEEAVLQLSTSVCILSSLVTIAMFLYMIDYSLKAMRPVSVIERVATERRKGDPRRLPRRARTPSGTCGARCGRRGRRLRDRTLFTKTPRPSCWPPTSAGSRTRRRRSRA